MSNQATTLGDRIREVRNALGLGQEQFAKALGFKPRAPTVSGWENNRSTPERETLEGIARLAAKPYAELFGEFEGVVANGRSQEAGRGEDRDVDVGEVFDQLRTIIEDTDTPPAYKVLMIDAVGGVLSRATLYRGEVTAGFRAVALREAEQTDRERQQTIRHVEENAHIRALELRREGKAPDAPLSPYNPAPEPPEGGERRTAG